MPPAYASRSNARRSLQKSVHAIFQTGSLGGEGLILETMGEPSGGQCAGEIQGTLAQMQVQASCFVLAQRDRPVACPETLNHPRPTKPPQGFVEALQYKPLGGEKLPKLLCAVGHFRPKCVLLDKCKWCSDPRTVAIDPITAPTRFEQELSAGH